jgi:hypothetical protein
MRKFKFLLPESYRNKKLYMLYPLFVSLRERAWGVRIYIHFSEQSPLEQQPVCAFIPTTWGATCFLSESINVENLLEVEEINKYIGKHEKDVLLDKYEKLELDEYEILDIIGKKMGKKKLAKILSEKPNIIDYFHLNHVFAFPLDIEDLDGILKYIEEFASESISKDRFLNMLKRNKKFFDSMEKLIKDVEDLNPNILITPAPIIYNEEELLTNINRCRKPECIIDKFSWDEENYYEEDYIPSIILYMDYDEVEGNITIKEYEKMFTKSYGKYMDYAKPVYATLLM